MERRDHQGPSQNEGPPRLQQLQRDFACCSSWKERLNVKNTHSYKFADTFSCARIDSRKARERELATFDENRQAVGMLNPMRGKTEGTYRGGEETTPETTACPEAGKSK